MAVVIFLAIVVVLIAMGVTGIVMAIEVNRTGVVFDRSGERGFTPGGDSCIAIKEGQSEGNPVGGNDLGGSKFHRAEKSCRRSRGKGWSVSLWY
uniref:Uncharacterized protein n=1 Tax=Romanomermis culicivorax TaxID=13658 RepID=A0A915I6Y4_ROMCU